MVLEVIAIRVKQIFRILGEIGLFRAIFLVALVMFAMWAVMIKMEEVDMQSIIIGAFVISIASTHIQRNDSVFLKINTPFPAYIFLVEYLILSSPLLVSLVIYHLWLEILFYLVFLVLVSFLSLSKNQIQFHSVFHKFIPNENFEWKAGLRKYYFPFLIVWISGFLASYFIISVPLAMVILCIIIMSFYEKMESWQVLISEELSPKQFLWKKIKKHLLIFTVVMLPLLFSFFIFHADYYYVVLIELFVFYILMIYTILLKYAFYQPDDSSKATQTFAAFGMISIFVPFFLAVILLLIIRFLFQAQKNLKPYLYDYNS